MINDCFVFAQLSGEYLFTDKQSWDKRLGKFLIPWDLGGGGGNYSQTEKQKLRASRKGLKAKMSLCCPSVFPAQTPVWSKLSFPDGSAFRPLEQFLQMKILQICFRDELLKLYTWFCFTIVL